MFYMNFFLSVSRNMESVCLCDGYLEEVVLQQLSGLVCFCGLKLMNVELVWIYFHMSMIS